MFGETWINECPRLHEIYKNVLAKLVPGQQPRWHKGVAGILCTDAMVNYFCMILEIRLACSINNIYSLTLTNIILVYHQPFYEGKMIFSGPLLVIDFSGDAVPSDCHWSC